MELILSPPLSAIRVSKVIQKERQVPPTRAFGDEVHTDIWGCSPTYSLGGRRKVNSC